MGFLDNINDVLNGVTSLKNDDNPKKLLPLIRQLDRTNVTSNQDKVIPHLEKARKHMDKMVKDNKITTQRKVWIVDNLMSAMFKSGKD